ncbi:hypothetical protein Csa_020916 [Cucumis sativus]|nr:hypothetical protein Csa_020916 [Cucumis sativus]
MANCLILLAQGDSAVHRRPTAQNFQHPLKINPKTSFNFEMAKTTSGFYVYECKTCNRTFPSFQALGGHRASHKKPKTTTMATALEDQPEEPQLIKIAASPVQIPTKTVTAGANFQTHKGGKVHECSICGLEFTSGQALGGHMRRHRATTAVSSAQQVVVATNTEEDNNTNHHHHHRHRNSVERKERNILELDLNLPAPEEDLRETKVVLGPTHPSVGPTPSVPFVIPDNDSLSTSLPLTHWALDKWASSQGNANPADAKAISPTATIKFRRRVIKFSMSELKRNL